MSFVILIFPVFMVIATLLPGSVNVFKAGLGEAVRLQYLFLHCVRGTVIVVMGDAILQLESAFAFWDGLGVIALYLWGEDAVTIFNVAMVLAT